MSKIALLFLAVALAQTPAAHAGKIKNLATKLKPKEKPSPVDQSLQAYLVRARVMNTPAPETTGSLWVADGPFARAAVDYKARKAGDLIVIRIADRVSSASSGQNQGQRQLSAQSGVTGLVGTLDPTNRLQDLLGLSSTSNLNGKGQTTLSTNLQLSMAGSVVEALPNGVLLVEAAREVAVGPNRHTVILRGLVRPGDVGPDNSVLSNNIGNLEIEVKGKGTIADATKQPNIVIRTLMRILTF
jgi:flagellar L-ring protein precursor FlgH